MTEKLYRLFEYPTDLDAQVANTPDAMFRKAISIVGLERAGELWVEAAGKRLVLTLPEDFIDGVAYLIKSFYVTHTSPDMTTPIKGTALALLPEKPTSYTLLDEMPYLQPQFRDPRDEEAHHVGYHNALKSWLPRYIKSLIKEEMSK